MNHQYSSRANREEAVAGIIVPFVRRSNNPLRMKEMYDRIGQIVGSCSRLERRDPGGHWGMEFYPGTDISKACEAAWMLHVLTCMDVEFPFNGSSIRVAA